MHNASRVEARTSEMTYCILSEPEEGHAWRAMAVGSTSFAADEAADPAYPSTHERRYRKCDLRPGSSPSTPPSFRVAARVPNGNGLMFSRNGTYRQFTSHLSVKK